MDEIPYHVSHEFQLSPTIDLHNVAQNWSNALFNDLFGEKERKIKVYLLVITIRSIACSSLLISLRRREFPSALLQGTDTTSGAIAIYKWTF